MLVLGVLGLGMLALSGLVIHVPGLGAPVGNSRLGVEVLGIPGFLAL